MPDVKGVPYIYGNTQYDCFELNSYCAAWAWCRS